MSDDLILNLLKNVKYPGFSRDLVSFGLVQQAEIVGKTAKVVLSYPLAIRPFHKRSKRSGRSPARK